MIKIPMKIQSIFLRNTVLYKMNHQKNTCQSLIEVNLPFRVLILQILMLMHQSVNKLLYVQKSNVKSRKKNYCTFCMKLQAQLPRHLETVHRNEPEVKKFAVLPKKDPERRKMIDSIRKMGNFKFNTNSVLNTGQLLVCRRPNEKTNKTATDFIACMKCKGFFAKSTIRHHSRICLKKDFQKNKSIMIMRRKITRRIHSVAVV